MARGKPGFRSWEAINDFSVRRHGIVRRQEACLDTGKGRIVVNVKNSNRSFHF